MVVAALSRLRLALGGRGAGGLTWRSEFGKLSGSEFSGSFVGPTGQCFWGSIAVWLRRLTQGAESANIQGYRLIIGGGRDYTNKRSSFSRLFDK
jgi:hypothetical protein